jgi:hypothetical protein
MARSSDAFDWSVGGERGMSEMLREQNGADVG